MGPSPTYHPPEGEECETSVEHGLPLWAEPAVGYCLRRPRSSPMWGSQDNDLVIDNKAVVDYGATTPHEECSDVDLRRVIETHQRDKQLRSRWIPSHRVIKRYHTEKEKEDIRHNDIVDRLAKLAAKLPLPEAALSRFVGARALGPWVGEQKPLW